jgi:dTDP-4-amino-4,6-dideoxygalactose transaminase
MQMDPEAFEAAITPRTKVVVVVHISACPSDMDRIMAIADRHGIAVLEDVSHAQGGHYKAKRVGNFGQVAAMSLMAGKSFAIGEGGMMVTDDYEIYRKAIRFGHYDRIVQVFSAKEIAETKNLPFGAMKNRLNQCAAAVGIEQVKKYDSERAEIERAMLYYWKQLEGVEGLRMMWPKDEGSDKAGWYASRCHYDPEAFGGLSNVTFARAVSAETQGGYTPGCYMPLHFSSLFGKQGPFPVTERINQFIISDPWFKHFDTAKIDLYAAAVRKVAAQWESLLPLDEGIAPCDGGLGLTDFEKKKRA